MKIFVTVIVALGFVMPGLGIGKIYAPPTTPGQIVLLVNAVEPELTHSHLGLTAFTTSNTRLANDWAIDRFVQQEAIGILEKSGYKVAIADGTPEQLAALRSDSYWTNDALRRHSLRPDLASWLQGEAAAKHAAVVVVLRTYGRPFSPMTYSQYSGYGLETLSGDPPRLAFLYANIAASVLFDSPFKPTAPVEPAYSDCRKQVDVASISTPSFKALNADALGAYRSGIESLAVRRVRQDLVASHLLSGSLERCKLERL